MKYKKYPSYKDSGVEWLGDIPDCWETVPLKTISKIDTCGCYGNDPEENGLLFPVATTAQIDANGKFNVPKMPIRSFTKSESKRYICKTDEILVVKSSGSATNIISGKAGLINKNTPPFIFSNFLMKVIPSKSQANASYIYNVLTSSLTRARIQKMVSATTYPNLKVNEYTSSQIPFPALQEQQKIADFLDKNTGKIDSLISKQEKLIKLLKEKRQAVISYAVTKGLDPNVPIKDSGVAWMGEIPEHWEIVPLRYLGLLQNGISKGAEYFGSGLPFINYGDIYNNYSLPERVKGLANSTNEDRLAYSVKRGDVFFTRTSETVDDIGMASTCLKNIPDATFSGFTIRFRQLNSTLFPSFSKYQFRSGYSQSFFVKEMNLVTRASLGQDLLKRLHVLIPSFKEQQLIAIYLEDKTTKIDTLVAKAEKSIELLKEKRTALISAAVTGKIDVREAA